MARENGEELHCTSREQQRDLLNKCCGGFEEKDNDLLGGSKIIEGQEITSVTSHEECDL